MSSIPPSFEALFEPFMRSAPVNVLACARQAGLHIYAIELPEGISGMIKREADGTFRCYVDKNEPNVRQRFTAAHELGHFVLHRSQIGDGLQDNYLLRAEGMSNSQEAQANRFAADLLMPKRLIAEVIAEGVNDVKRLAKRFEVSEIAMSIRLGLPT